MNIQPVDEQSQQISDDQELAKVLAGVNASDDDAPATDVDTVLPTPTTPPPAPLDDMPTAEPAVAMPTPSPVGDIAPTSEDSASAAAPADPELDRIKQQALGELRPLVDKLNVPAEEKFDTYLLLLRSTDDKALIAPAHEAANSITDEARRAQALLDIIKEIDFLSQAQQ